MKRLLIPLLATIMVCLTLTAYAAGDGIAFDAGINTVVEGETLQTVLTREGDAASGELTFMSSDQKYATVDENGVVTGLKKGRVVITANVKTEKKNYKAQLKVTILRPVTSVTVNTAKLPVYAAADEKVAPYLSARDNAEENELPVLLLPVKKRIQLAVSAEPKDATNRNIQMTSSDEAVFTAIKGAVTGVGPGEGILTIASESNPDITTRFRVLVVQPVTKLIIESSAPTVTVGEQVTVTAVASPDNATVKQVTWSSGDERIIKVDENGTVTGVKRGNGRIIATAADGSNIRANFNIKVVQNPESITLSAPEMTIDVGKTQAVRATVEPKDADNKKVVWTSSDENVATVSKDGRIKAITVGECTVTCTSEALGTVQASLTVHVQQPVKKIAFTAKKDYAFVGETTQLSWTVEPANATNQVLSFKSSKESILTVDENGLVTGVSSGKANVDAVTTDGSKRKARIQVQVGKHVSGVEMRRRHAYLDLGETATAGAVIEPKDAIDKRMTWESSDESIVTANGDTNEKMKLKGKNYGNAVVTGTTVDGGFQTSIPVTVGNYDKGIQFRELNYDKNAYFWLQVRNNTDVTITSIYATVEMYDASESGKPELAINTKNGSNKVDLIWNGTLHPGETTGKSNWKLANFRLDSPHISDTCGTVTIYKYIIDHDWEKYIRKSTKPSKKFGY